MEREISGVPEAKLFGGEGIRKSFGRKAVLEGADLRLPVGGIVGIFGLNGAGKTTLLRILAGLDSDFSGSLYKADFEDVGYMAPDENFPPDMTVRGAVDFFDRFGKGADGEAIFSALRAANIREKQLLLSMSLGMRQYFRFLLTVHCATSVCLFDEPFTNLDVNLRARVADTMIRECGDDRLFLVTTHEIKEIETLIDGFFVLKGGRLSEYYPSEDVRERTGKSVEEFYRDAVNGAGPKGF